MPAIDFAEDTIDFQQESIPIDFQPEGKSDKYLAMQAEQAALAKKDKGGTAMKALEFTEGVMDKAAHPVRAIMDFPVHLTQALGGQAQTVSTIPFVSPEAATKAIEKTIEFVSPFREASEGSFGQTVQEFAGEMLSGMTSPEMLGTLAVSPASPAAVARYFQGQMLSQVPASVAAVAEAEPGKEQNKAILAAAANVIFPALIEKGMTPAAPKTVLEARAAEVGPATEAVVKGKGVTESPLEPSVPLATAASESVKPAGVELPASAERPLPTSSMETGVIQPSDGPLIVMARRMGDTIRLEFDASKKRVTPDQIREMFAGENRSVQVRSLAADEVSTTQGRAFFEVSVHKPNFGPSSEALATTAYKEVFGSDAPILGRSAVEQALPLEQRLSVALKQSDGGAMAERVTELRAPETPAPAAPVTLPAFTMTFEQFMEAPREGRLLEELRQVPKQPKTTEQQLAEGRLDVATKAIEDAKLEWIYDRSNPNKRSQIEANIRHLTKAKKKIVAEYNDALSAKLATDTKARPERQRVLYNALVEKGVIQDPKAAPKPELVGMGAATPAEYAQTPQTATGVRNAIVDADLVKRGLPPAMTEARRANDVFWEQAMAQMDRDPGLQKRLIDELASKPRSVSDTEVAILTHRKVDLENEYGKATRDLAQAFDDGRMEDVAREQMRTDALREELHEFYTVTRAAGTEQARGLAARRLLVFEDFTLAKMELERRAAKGGERLTPQEQAEVVTLQNKIETTQKAYDAYVAKTQQQISALEVKAALQAATQKAQADVPPKVLEIAKRIVNNLHREADAARERLRSQGVKFGSGPLHELPNIRDYAIIGADHLVTTGVKFAEWSGKMVKEFGDGIKPHLQAIFEESQKTLNTIDKNSAFVQPTKRAKAKPTAEEGKLSFEASKAKKEWQEKLIEERRSRLPALKKAFGMTGEVLNTTRAIITSFDLSAVLRQGGFITLAHPIRAAKSLMPMLRAFRSEANAHAVNLEIASRPNYPIYHQAKLYLSEHGHKLSQMEEAYMSRWAEKIPLVAGSQRAYTTFLNKLRADSFDAMEATLSRNGKVTPEEATAIANFINIATGRGRIGFKENAAVGLNTVFFAPRYVASRFQLLAGSPMWGGTLKTRTAIAKEYARYLMGLGVVYGLGQLAGAEVETDSRSSDFGKLRFGDTRIDPLSGLQQIAVLESRLLTGETKRISGKVVPIRGEKVPYGAPDASDVLKQFVRTKLSPAFGTGVDVTTGENVVGEPVTPGSVVQNLTVPLAFRDIYAAMREQGVPEGTAMGLLSILGMGLQTYEPRK